MCLSARAPIIVGVRADSIGPRRLSGRAPDDPNERARRFGDGPVVVRSGDSMPILDMRPLGRD